MICKSCNCEINFCPNCGEKNNKKIITAYTKINIGGSIHLIAMYGEEETKQKTSILKKIINYLKK